MRSPSRMDATVPSPRAAEPRCAHLGVRVHGPRSRSTPFLSHPPSRAPPFSCVEPTHACSARYPSTRRTHAPALGSKQGHVYTARCMAFLPHAVGSGGEKVDLARKLPSEDRFDRPRKAGPISFFRNFSSPFRWVFGQKTLFGMVFGWTRMHACPKNPKSHSNLVVFRSHVLPYFFRDFWSFFLCRANVFIIKYD